MKRRAFLKTSMFGLAAAATVPHLGAAPANPDVETVPDTLDLADRARLAISGMGGNIDPALMTMYGMIHFCTPRPCLSHWGSAETLCDPKFAESFPLMRLMSGSDQYADLERAFRTAILARVDDGLYWDRVNPRRPWRNSYSAWLYGQGRDEDFCTVVGTGRLLRALLVWRELGDGADCERLLNELCAGLRRILVVKGDYGFYPANGGWGEVGAYPRSGWLNTDEAKSETEGGEGTILGLHGHQLYGAAHWYEQSGSPVALDLAAKLANYCLLPKFWGGVADPHADRKSSKLPGHIASRGPDPLFMAGSELGHWYSHFHCRAVGLRGLLAYGHATANARVLEFVRRAYEFTLTQGIARLGWINCYPGAPSGWSHVEACALGDLVGLAIRLTDAGLGDYWDDVDAVVRNHLAEQQITRTDGLEKVVAHYQKLPDHIGKKAPGELCFDRVLERSVGTFFAAARPADIGQPVIVCQCCTGNASQGLYYAWEGALREHGDRATLNLFLNRAGRLVNVDSYLPYEGKVVIRNKQARSLAVRLPSWVDKRELVLTPVKLPADPYWAGRYLIFDALPPSLALTLTFPIRTQTATYTVDAGTRQERKYTCEFRGSTCVHVSPHDAAPTSIPLYQRSQMRATTAPCRLVRRFIPPKLVYGW